MNQLTLAYCSLHLQGHVIYWIAVKRSSTMGMLGEGHGDGYDSDCRLLQMQLVSLHLPEYWDSMIVWNWRPISKETGCCCCCCCERGRRKRDDGLLGSRGPNEVGTVWSGGFWCLQTLTVCDRRYLYCQGEVKWGWSGPLWTCWHCCWKEGARSTRREVEALVLPWPGGHCRVGSGPNESYWKHSCSSQASVSLDPSVDWLGLTDLRIMRRPTTRTKAGARSLSVCSKKALCYRGVSAAMPGKQ